MPSILGKWFSKDACERQDKNFTGAGRRLAKVAEKHKRKGDSESAEYFAKVAKRKFGYAKFFREKAQETDE